MHISQRIQILHKLSHNKQQHESSHTKTQEAVSEVTENTWTPLQTEMNTYLWTHYCTHTNKEAYGQSQAHKHISLHKERQQRLRLSTGMTRQPTVRWKQWQLRSAITWNINKNPFTETSHWDVPLFPLSRYMPLGLRIIHSAIHTAVQDESSRLHAPCRHSICDII